MWSIIVTIFCLGSAFALPQQQQHQQRASNGPVISSNFMDPCIVQVGSTYYAYSGPNGNPPVHVQYAKASTSNPSSWQVLSADVLPDPGVWVTKGDGARIWAPDVVQLPSGSFVLYYAASLAVDGNRHCIGAATASVPEGPFTPQSQPLICDRAIGGAIDLDALTDPVSGNHYLVYKIDGNSIGHGGACSNSVAPIVPTPIMLQQIDPADGVSLIGAPFEILTNIGEDGPCIEAPSLLYDPAQREYVLFYNSECFTSKAYAIKYATSRDITGPYVRQGIFLETGSTAANIQLPGGIDVIQNSSLAVLHGDFNLGWLAGDGSKRVRAMYVLDMSLADPISPGRLL